MVTRRILITIVAILTALSIDAANKKFTLVIDAGHGGHDIGAPGSFSKEKDINLNVALAFGKLVEDNCPDVNVIYTRKKDVFVALHERANIANRNKADLFISIHTNALPNGKRAVGMETYTLGMHRASDNFDVAKRENSVILYENDYKQHYEGFDPNSSESYIIFELMQDKNMANSVELAKYVQRRTCAIANRPNKGVKQAGFLVLRETSMPSCLIELGFITTPSEETLLNSESGISSIGKGIYNAFLDYKKKYYGGVVVPYMASEKKETVSIPQIVPDNETPTTTQQETSKKPVSKQEQGKQESDKKATEQQETSIAPVFKVQILVSDKQLRSNSPLLKGEQDSEMYEENGMYKYTVGSSENYNEIYRLRKTLIEKFPDAFIIAFKNGEKMNVVEAIKEYKANKAK